MDRTLSISKCLDVGKWFVWVCEDANGNLNFEAVHESGTTEKRTIIINPLCVAKKKEAG